jgi:hypothetical protein
MVEDSIFAKVGFSESMKAHFVRLANFIEDERGCNASVYKPPNMKEARAAHVPPIKSGKKKAQQVFLMIRPRRDALQLKRRDRNNQGKPKSQMIFTLTPDFSDWELLERTMMEWSLDPKQPRRPKDEWDYGDGVALPGGLPETNPSKF